MSYAQKYLQQRERVNRAFDAIWMALFNRLRSVVLSTGELSRFGIESFRLLVQRPFRWSEIVSHMEFIGNQSVMIIVLSGTFTGAALAFQIYVGFKIVNAASLVGPVVGLGISRELGPVLTGLIVAARAGGAMAARLGTMRVTEQIDALEVMGVNPIQYLVSPRVIAAVLVMPMLTAIFDFVAMVGCWFLAITLLDMDEAQFWERTAAWVEPWHIYEGLFKAAVFGLFFAVVCTHRGYMTKGGAEGVGSSTNRGVVLSMVLIICSDFFLTNIITAFYNIKARFFA